MLKVQTGKELKSASTFTAIPKFASAPRRMPQGKYNNRAAASLETMSSYAYFSSHLNL